MTIAVRPATGGDVAAIDALLRRSFPSADEAQLVQRLCIDGDMVLTLVADDEESGELAGIVAFSRMSVDGGGRAVPAVALAPVAVAAPYRRQGVAEALIQAGLNHLGDAGAAVCFVLGDPAFYERFGFSAEHAQGFQSPYAGDYLMAKPLRAQSLGCATRGKAEHAPAFAMLGQAA
ncbi:GNAT family N-acetyltransferase [Sphingomonas turrisvirgatae]|uniref:GNAT family N-acetyltransferase n=1 Tax=Sphingomonas turrisvirgatae TaxID=1888892 RepID=A0A1E3M152_9SPHN|nr:N-acetyltransferase [Sphingomonas turrisvirgatae]ODP39732.1 GNAT family N-acetyltransferase [Sphingomonas turrisvirgatae]